MTGDLTVERLSAEITDIDSRLQDAFVVHDDLHSQLDTCITSHNDHVAARSRLIERYKKLADQYQHSGAESVRAEANGLVSEINALLETIQALEITHRNLEPAHNDARSLMVELADQKNRLNAELRATKKRLEGSTSTWSPAGSQPPNVGTIAGTDHVVSFKTGGKQGDGTLIADGDYSDDRDGFDENHNHYGSRREGPGYFSKDRGHYTGPDH